MRGVALEGGGARGAYHIGVVRALLENGYELDGFVGTSIGAVNAAILAQGDLDKAAELWENISVEQIFVEEEQPLAHIADFNKLWQEKSLPPNSLKAAGKVLKQGGFDTTKMRTFLEEYINEDKIRKSKKDFGLVTISTSDLKVYELVLEDIPRGDLVSYLMASVSLPMFQREVIDGKKFLDGGFYNNMPFNLLLDKGYEEIVAIKTGSIGRTLPVDVHKNIKVISVNENLGNLMIFTPEHSKLAMTAGYYDGIKFLKEYRGTCYYIDVQEQEEYFINLLSTLPEHVIEQLGKSLNIPFMPDIEMLFEGIIPSLARYLKLPKNVDYSDFVVGVLEYAAKQRNIDKYKVYKYKQFRDMVRKTPKADDKSLLSVMTKNKEAIELLSRFL